MLVLLYVKISTVKKSHHSFSALFRYTAANCGRSHTRKQYSNIHERILAKQVVQEAW